MVLVSAGVCALVQAGGWPKYREQNRAQGRGDGGGGDVRTWVFAQLPRTETMRLVRCALGTKCRKHRFVCIASCGPTVGCGVDNVLAPPPHQSIPDLGAVPSFRFDLVDVARPVLAAQFTSDFNTYKVSAPWGNTLSAHSACLAAILDDCDMSRPRTTQTSAPEKRSLDLFVCRLRARASLSLVRRTGGVRGKQPLGDPTAVGYAAGDDCRLRCAAFVG